jgi:hypothetical protein
MAQSDALSWRPDFVPDIDNDNEDIMMLPDNLFINLIDNDLQQRIANCDLMDKDTTDTMTTLLEQGPTTVQNDLDDWTSEKYKMFFSTKERITFPWTKTYDDILQKCFMITKRLGTLGNWKPSTRYDIITGGQDYVHLSKTMSKDAEPANSLK